MTQGGCYTYFAPNGASNAGILLTRANDDPQTAGTSV